MVEFYPLSITGNRKPRVIVSRIQQRFKAFSHSLGNWRSISLTVLLLLFYTAASAQFSLSEAFKGSTVNSNIVVGGAPNAILTSGGFDPANDGWLRLTSTAQSQQGYAYVNTPFPSTLGISIDFEYKTWRDVTDGYGGADGISLFLFDATVPFKIGAYGGSLGYAGDGVNTLGMAGGYLGVGFDEFGSFSTSGSGRAGGAAGTAGLRPNSVALRGATTTNATTSCPYLTGVTLTNNTVVSNTVTGNGVEDEIDYNTATATRPTDAQFYRRVQVQIVPSGGQYMVTVKWTKTPNGAFTTLLTYTTATPPPANVKLGFAASTGGGINYHEIRNLRITTPGGVSTDKAVNKANAQVGDVLTYTVNAYNSTTAAISGLILTDALQTSTSTTLPPSNFTTQSVTFNNNGNATNTAAGYVNGVAKTTGLTNPFNATLNMAASSKSTFTVTGVVNAVPTAGIIKNTVTVDPTNTGITDQDLTNNTFAVNTNVYTPPNVDLQLTGTVDGGCFFAGGANSYTFNVANLGPAATGGILPVTVNITIPAGTNYIYNTSDASWTLTINGNVYSFSRTNSLASGGTYPPIYLLANPPAAGAGLGSALPATVVFGGAEANTTNNSVSVLTYQPPAAPVTTNISYCQGATAVPLTATGTNLKWYTVASGGTASTVAPTPVTTTPGTTTYYVSSSNGTCESTLTPITVTVLAQVGNNTIVYNNPYVCYGNASVAITGSQPTGGAGTYTYLWQQSTDGGTSWTTATGVSNAINYSPPVATITKLYRRLITSDVCSVPNISNQVTINVIQPISNNVITPPANPLCGSGDPGIIMGNIPSNGGGSFVYQWQSSTDNINFVTTDVSSVARGMNYDPGVITSTTYYRRLASSTICGDPLVSNSVTITVNPALSTGAGNSIAGDQVFCQSGTPAAFTETTAATGGNGTYTYQWQSSTTTSTTGFTNITGAVSKTYTPTAAINQTTYYRRVVSSGSCTPLISNPVTVTVNPSITGNTLTAPAITSFCVTGTPGIITGSVPSGGSGSYTYSWEQSTNNGTTWTTVAGAAAKDFTPAAISQTTQYRRRVSSGTCTDVSTAVTFTVSPLPTTAAAGPNIQQCNIAAFIMAANTPVNGTGVWSVVSGNAVIANTASPTTGVTLSAGQTATLAWTISNGSCSPSSAQVVLTNYALPTTANAGADITQYNSGIFTLQGNAPVSGTGVWTVKSGSVATIASPANRNTTATIAPNTTATLVWTITNGNCAVSTDEVVITYTRAADIKVVKSIVTPGPFVAGQSIVYRIIASNAGPTDATGLNILDNVPADVVVSTINTSVAGSAAVTQNTSAGNAVNVTANIAAGAGNTVTVDVNGVISPVYSGTLANTATVTSPNVPDPDGATSTVTTPVLRKPILNLVKTGPANSIAGSPITYQVTLSNTGTGNAIGTAITDAIPAQVINTTWTLAKTGTAVVNGATSGTGNNISFTGNIPAGAGNTIVINVTGTVSPSATGSFVNTATATPAEPVAPVTSNPVTTTISSQSGLVMLKNGPAAAQAGTAVTYTLKVNNTGLSDAMNATITDIVPAEIKNVSWTATVQNSAVIIGTATGTGNSITLNGNIPAGSTNAINVTITGTVDPSFAGNSTNTATATPSEAGSQPSVSTVTTAVSRTPVITLVKTAPATLTAGQQITYTIDATNLSVADAKALVLSDNVPATLTNVTWTASTTGTAGIIGTGNGTGNAISIAGNLPAGAGNKITITVTGKVAAAFNGALVNTAVATPAEPGTTATTATATTQISRVPVINILKTGPATITAGQQITYTIEVTNTGTSDALLTAITDAVPASIKNVTWTTAAAGTAIVNTGATGTGNNVNVNVNVPGGGSNKVTITIRGDVDPGFNGSIVNTAKATPAESGTTPVTSTVTSAATRTPVVSISKTGPATLTAGQNITYTITANNFSTADAKALLIADQVPASVTNVSWSAVASGAAAVNGTASGNTNAISVNADLPAGSSNAVTITVTGQVAPSFDGTLTNTATATPAEPGTVPQTATSTATVSKIPILSIQKTGPASLSAGQQLNYTLTITNTGTANADNAVISDILPAGISNVSWSAVAAGNAAINGTASGTSSTISLNANIPAGAANTIVVNIQGTVSSSATGNLVNTATVTPAESGTVPSSSTVTTALNSSPAINIVKTGPSEIAAGQTVTYTVSATNSGPSDANNMSITDAVPAVLTNVSWTAVSSGTASLLAGDTGTGNAVLVKGNIGAGAGNSILITITGQVPGTAAAGTIVNTAVATPAESGVLPVTSNAVSTTIKKSVNIVAVKSAAAVLSAGENITYTLKVTNNGPSDAQNLQIADQLPAGISNISWTATGSGTATVVSGASGTGTTVNLSANVPSGIANSILVTVTGVIDPDFTGTSLTNAFTATPSEPGNPPVTSNTTTTTISKNANIQILKTGPATALAGQAIAYTISVNNAGPANAANVTIADAVPAGITNVQWTATAANGAVINSGATGNVNAINVTAAIPSGNALVTINVTGTIDPDFNGNIVNTATATPENGVTDVTPATSTVTTAVSRTANVRIIKTGPADITAGGTITYNLRVINNGPGNAPGVVINDLIDPAITGVSWTAGTINGAVINTGGTGTGNTVNLTADIPSGTAEVDVVITGTVNPATANGTNIINTATAGFPSGSPVTDPDLSSNTSTVNSKVNLDTELKVSKSGPSTTNIGDRIDYRIEIKNGGASDINNASITDNVPNDIAITSWTATTTGTALINGAASGTTNNILTSGNIPATIAGVESTIVINVTGTVKATAGTSFTNTVTVDANGQKQSSVVTSVNQFTDVYIEQSGSQTVNAGSAVTYQLKIGNNGPIDVNGVNIADNIPAGIKNVTWTATVVGNSTLSGAASGTGNAILTTANLVSGAGNYILINVQGTVDPAFASGNLTNTATAVLPTPGVTDINTANNTSTVTTAVVSTSGLSIRDAGPATALSGTEITYTIVVENAGPSNALGAIISDNIPANLSNVSWTAAATGTANITAGTSGTGNAISVTGDIPAGTGNTVTITVKGTIAPEFTGSITSNAIVTPSEAGNPPVTSGNVVTLVTNQSSLNIVKSGPSTVQAGKTVQYTLQVTNGGPGNALNAVITDAVPAGLTNISWTAAAANGAIVKSAANGTSNPVIVTADVPAGAGIVTINISGDVPANSAAGVLTNTASVQPSEPGNPLVTSNQVNTIIAKNVNLTLTKSGPATLNAGDAITYTLAITNTGPSDATGANLTDQMPAGLTNVSWTSTATGGAVISNGATGTGNNLALTADIPVNATVLVNVSGVTDPLFKGTLTNTAMLMPAEPGEAPLSATAVTTVKNQTNLIITKSGPANAVAGQVMTYQVKVSNSGPSTAANALITDAIPAQLAQVSWTAAATGNAVITAGATGMGNALSVKADIPAGQGNEVTIDITGTVSAAFGGSISNIATVTPSDPDNPAVTTAPVTTVVTQNPIINLSKTGPATATAGGQISYTIEANNSGLSNAANLVIADQVPAAISNINWTAVTSGNSTLNSSANGTGNAISVNGNIPSGAGNKITITVTGTVNASFAGNLNNTATATPSEPGNPVITTPAVVTAVTQTPVIVIHKTGDTFVTAGSTISYVIEASNSGLSNAANLAITDQVNPAITGVTWTAVTSGGSSINGAANGTGNTISVNGNIPAGAGNKISITINGTVSPAFDGKIVNIATGTPSEPGNPPVVSPAVETNVHQQPVVALTKTAAATATAGSELVYTITAVNTGLSDATGVDIEDNIAPNLTNVSWTSSAAGAATVVSGGTGTGNHLILIGNIPAGAANNKITIVVKGTIDPAFTGMLSNIATSSLPGNNTNTTTPPAQTQVGSTPGVVINKNGPATAMAGAEVTYTITTGNTGLSNAENLLITDQVPATLSNVSWTASQAGTAVINAGATGTGNVIAVNANIPAGTGNTVVVTVKGTIAPSFGGNLANTAVATPSEPNTVPVTSTSTTVVSKIPVLAIAKNGPASISAGQAITYTIQVNNTGTANAVNAAVTDAVPVNVNAVSWQAVAQGTAAIISGASGSGNNINLHADLPAGAGNGVLITVNGVVNSSATANLVNTATVTPSEPGSAAVSSAVTTTLSAAPAVSLVKTGPSAISAGQSVTYTLTAINNGPSDAHSLAISDAVPAGLTNVQWTASATGTATVLTGTNGTGNAVLVNGNIPAGTGNTIVVTITGTVPASATGSVLNNTATATPSEPGIAPVSSNQVTTTVNHKVNIRAVKSAPSVVSAGENITYTLQVINDGPGDAANLIVADAVPASLKNVSWTTTTAGTASVAENGTGTGNAVNLKVNLPAGAANTATVVVTGQVDPAFTGTAITNTFTATPAEAGNPPVSSTPVTTTVGKTADIQIQKTGSSAVVAGSAISYTLTVKNAGPGNAQAVDITDVIPAGINAVSWTAAAQNGALINGAANGTGNVNLNAAIPAGTGIIVVTVNGTVDAGYAGANLVNTATATPEPGITDPTPATSTVTATTSQLANVRITKSGPANIGAGETITYNLRVVNDGPSAATGIAIKDALPSNLEPNANWTASAQNGATVSAASGTGDIDVTGNIPSGTGEINIVITGKVKSSNADGTTFSNTATANFPAGSPVTDPDLNSNVSTISTMVNNDPVLKVSKSGPSNVNIGDPVNYTIVVRNAGAADIFDAQISDPVPADVAVTSWNMVATGGAVIKGTANGTTNTILTSADLPADGNPNTAVTINVTGVVQPAAGTSFTNTVTVTANGQRTSSVVTAVNQSIDIKVEEAGPQSVNAGDPITYTIKVSNAGPMNATGLVINDNIPAQIGQVSWSAQAFGAASLTGPATGNTSAVQTVANVPVSAANYILITVTGVVKTATPAGTITNMVSVALPAGISDLNLANNTSRVNTVINAVSGLKITKSGPQNGVSGSAVTYTLNVINTGPGDASQAQITDMVPSGISQVSWTAVSTGSAVINSGLNGTGSAVGLNANIPAGSGNGVIVTINGTIDAGFSGTIVNQATVTPSEPGNLPVTSGAVTTTVVNQSNIRIVKSGPTSIQAGKAITYTLELTNAGPGNAMNAAVSDLISSVLTNVNWTATASSGAVISSGATGSGNQVTLNADLPAGSAKVVVNITAQVPADATPGNISNIATVTPSEPGNPPVTSNEIITGVTNNSNLTLIKNGPSAANAGQTITYTLAIGNTGPSDANGVQLQDVVPATLTNVSWTSSLTGGSVISTGSAGTGNTVALTANVPANGTVLVTVTGQISPSFAGVITNQALLTPADPAKPVITSQVSTTVTKLNSLSIIKTGPASVTAGEQVKYQVTATNNGPSDAAGLSISDNVPIGLTNVSWTAVSSGTANILAGGTGTGNTVQVSGNIAAGTGNQILITITGQVPSSAASGTIQNTAIATPAEPGVLPVTSNTITTMINNNAALQIQKTGPATALAGQMITYTLAVNNAGPSDAAGVQLKDVVPAQLSNVSWTSSLSGGAVVTKGQSGTGNSVALTANVPASGAILVTVTGTVDPVFAGTLTNQATLTPADLSIPVISSNAVNTVVTNQPALSITKTGAGTITAGQSMNYQIKVVNNGPGTAQNAVISDVIQAALTHVNWATTTAGAATVSAGQSGTGNNLNVTATIPAGAVVTIDVTGTVDPGYVGQLNNIATVTPTEPGVTPVVTPAVITAVNDVPGIAIIKTGPATAVAGQTVTYTVTATNSGVSDAANLGILDNVPAGLTNVSWTAVSSGTAAILAGGTGTGNMVQVRGNIAAGSGNQILVTITGQIPSAAAAGTLQNVAVAMPSEPGLSPVNSNTISTVITKVVNITAVKSAPASLSAGQNITYTLNVTNSGPSDAQNLQIADQLPAGINTISWTATGNGAATVVSGASGTGSAVSLLANVPAGTANSIVVTVTGMIDPGFNGTQLVNSFTATPSEPDNAAVTSNTTITTINNKAGLTIVKTGPATIGSGQTITYTLTVNNTGPSIAAGILLTDVVPSQLSNVSWTSVVSGGAVITTGQSGTGNTVAQTVNVPVNGTVLVTVTGTVDPVFAGTLTNQATLTPSDPSQPVISSNTINTTVSDQPVLSITKTGAGTVTAGQLMKYQIRVVNNSTSTAQNAVISDVIQAALTNVSWITTTTGAATVSAGQNGTGNNLAVTATIPAGAVVTVDITGTVNPGYTGQLSNIATLSPAEPGVPPIVTPAVLTVVSNVPGIKVVKTGSSDLKSGEAISYTIEVTNTGLSDAMNLTLTDLISSDITNVKWTTVIAGNAVILSGQNGTGNTIGITGNLPAGTANKITLNVTGLVSKSFTGRILNTAKVILPGAADVNSNTVETVVALADFVIPNIITPNGDGENDTFKIKGLEDYPGTQVLIFNRWGNEVYKSVDYRNDWDGSQLNEGTYYYLIKRKDKQGNVVTFKGWLFIKR